MLYTMGSSSAIFACNLSTLGVSVNFVGSIGKDDFGEKILNELHSKNVNTSGIIRSDTAATGITVAFNYQQQRGMVTYPGAMNELSEADITDEMLQNARHLHVSSVFIQPALKPGLTKLFKRAKQFGLTTSLDPQWDSYEQWQCDWQNLLPLVDVFLPNMEELKNITQESTLQNAVNSIKHHTNILTVKNSIEGAIAFYKN